MKQYKGAASAKYAPYHGSSADMAEFVAICDRLNVDVYINTGGEGNPRECTIRVFSDDGTLLVACTAPCYTDAVHTLPQKMPHGWRDLPVVTKKGRPRGIQWGNVDFTRSAKELAKELGCSRGAVYAAAYARAISPATVRVMYDWGKVDFTKPAAGIARDVGCTPEAVHSAASRLGVVLPKRYGWLESVDWVTVSVGKTPVQLARELGCSNGTVLRYFRANDIPYKRRNRKKHAKEQNA